VLLLIHAPELLHAPYVFAKLAIFPLSATDIKQNNVYFTGSKKSEGDIESMKTAYVQSAERHASCRREAGCLMSTRPICELLSCRDCSVLILNHFSKTFSGKYTNMPTFKSTKTSTDEEHFCGRNLQTT
jgi:hypothetical protein